MPHQNEKKQIDNQLGQETIHLISHQLLNSVAKLQIVYELWAEAEAHTQVEQLRQETLPILRHEIEFLQRG